MSKIPLSQLTTVTGNSQEIKKQKQLIHVLRTKNMELRMNEAKLKRENASFKTENKKLQATIDVLQEQCSADCKTILSQIKQLEEYSEVCTQSKVKNARLKQSHKKISSLFDSTLKIKLQYERIIERLYEAADTQGLTKAVIEAVKPKQKPNNLEDYSPDRSPVGRHTVVNK